MILGGVDRAARKKIGSQAITKIIDKAYIMPYFSHLLNTIIYPDIDSNLQEWHIRSTLRNAAFNVIFGSLFGKDKLLPKTSKKFIEVSTGLERLSNFAPLGILPRFFYIPSIFGIKNWILKQCDSKFEKGYIAFHKSLEEYIEDAIENHKNKQPPSGPDDNGNDENENENENDSNWTLFDELYQSVLNTNGKINNEMLVSDICNLFGAGVDTTSIVLEVAILYLCKYKNVQKDIYHELLAYSKGTANEYENNKREFIYGDYFKCIKFRAFLSEVLRVGCVGPFGLPRHVSTKCVLKFNYNKQKKECENVLFSSVDSIDSDNSGEYEYEYIIDESFILSPNYLYIMRDNKTIWGKDSSKFNINRWMTKDNKKFENNTKSMPFSFGKRNCLGQVLAEKEIRILIANLILNYQFQSNDKNVNNEKENIVMDIGLTRFVKNETPVVVKQRKGKTRRYSRDLTDSVKDLGLITENGDV